MKSRHRAPARSRSTVGESARLLAALLAIGTVVSAGAASAQGIGYRSQENQAMRSREPNYTPGENAQNTTRHIDIRALTAVIYDSNIARADQAVSAKRGLNPQDVDFQPGASIDAFLPVGRETVFVKGGGGYDFHIQNPRLDRYRANIDSGASADFGPCHEKLEFGYDARQAELENVTVINKGVGSLQQNEKLDATAVCGSGAGLRPSVGFNEDWFSNARQSLGLASHHVVGEDVALGYVRPGIGDLSIFGAHRSATYPEQLLFGFIPFQAGYTLWAGGVSLSKPLGPFLLFTGSVSYTSLQPDQGGSQPFRGLTYSVSAQYHSGERLMVRIEGQRATLPANFAGASYSVDQTVTGSARYKLSRKIDFDLGGSAKSRSYAASAATTLLRISHEDQYQAFVGARYQLGRRWTFSLDARREQRYANISMFNYGDTRVTLTASTRF